jgi:hypothetical protein
MSQREFFLDGKYVAVESDRQCETLGGQRGSANIDIWKLKLDGTGKDFVRLTHFNDFEGGKAAIPLWPPMENSWLSRWRKLLIRRDGAWDYFVLVQIN